jgi:predicted transposase YbfD/YdcC
LIAVKKNQPTLYSSLEARAKTTIPLSQNITEDTSHGRHITRRVSVFEVPDSITSLWGNSQKFIRVERSGTRGTKSYQERAYYLSICQKYAEIFGDKIRGHWRIENQLHWVKDVIFQ